MNRTISALLLCLALIACTKQPETKGEGAQEISQTLYFGGHILTMAGDTPEFVEALLVEGEVITFTGSMREALALTSKNYAEIDLGGKTLMPGFPRDFLD